MVNFPPSHVWCNRRVHPILSWSVKKSSTQIQQTIIDELHLQQTPSYSLIHPILSWPFMVKAQPQTQLILHHGHRCPETGTRMLLRTSIDGFSKPLDVGIADLNKNMLEITRYHQFVRHFQRETRGFHGFSMGIFHVWVNWVNWVNRACSI